MSIIITPTDPVKYPVPTREDWSSITEDAVKGVFASRPSGLVMQATINETHNVVVTYTSEPIEDGRKISDHATVEPATLSVNCLISDDPSVIFGGGIADNLTSRGQKFSDDVYQYLKLLAEEKAQMSIETARGIYENMRIASMSDDITSDTGNAANLAIEFIEIRTAYSESSSELDPVSDEDTQKSAKKKTNGTKSKTTVGESDHAKIKESNSTPYYDIVDYVKK